MRTSAHPRPVRRRCASALLLLLAAGCASARDSRDLVRVAELARAPLPELAAAGARSAPPPEVAPLLDRPLDADSAALVALLNNRRLRAALLEVHAARARAEQAGALPNPVFEFELRKGSGDLPLEKDFLLEYDLTRAALAGLRSGVGRHQLEAEQVRAAAAAVELGYRVRAAYFAWRAAQQRLAVGVRTLDSLVASRDAARAVFAAGNVTELDLLLREAAYQSARDQVATLELAALERREALQRLLGLEAFPSAWAQQQPSPLPPAEPPAADAADAHLDAGAVARAVRASLELNEVRARLQALAAETGLARAEGWIPDVALVAHVEQEEGEWEYGGGARIRLPLLDRRQAALGVREAEFDALAERYQATALEVASRARVARSRLESAYRRSRHLAEVVLPARRRVVEHALRQLNAMAVSVFDLLRYQRELLDSELSAVDALLDYWLARAGWDAVAAGGRAPDSPLPEARALPAAPPSPGGH